MFICEHKYFKPLAVCRNVIEVTFPSKLQQDSHFLQLYLMATQNLSQTIK